MSTLDKIIKYLVKLGGMLVAVSYTHLDVYKRQAEITEMELSMEGGMRAYIKRIIAAKSQLELVKMCIRDR